MIEFQVESVPDFLRLLLPTEPHLPFDTWLFRGHGDATWGLVPSIRREKSWKRFGGAQRFDLQCERGLVVSSEDDLGSVESDLLRTLAEVIDRMGLPPFLRESDRLIAFAQHLGLPTRLLDWSRSPWTAAYFAGATAVQSSASTGRLAVFAMSTLFLNHSDSMKTVEPLQVGGAGNPNLIAQQGRLIKVSGEQIDLLSGVAVRREAVGYRPGIAEASAIDNHLVRVTLPWDMAPKLIAVLRSQEIHAATIYPGNIGVAELVREIFMNAF